MKEICKGIEELATQVEGVSTVQRLTGRYEMKRKSESVIVALYKTNQFARANNCVRSSYH